MQTTVLIIEFLVIGMFANVALAMFAAKLLGFSDSVEQLKKISSFKDYVPLFLILLTIANYVTGSLINENFA